jgi:peptidase A4-like protein
MRGVERRQADGARRTIGLLARRLAGLSAATATAVLVCGCGGGTAGPPGGGGVGAFAGYDWTGKAVRSVHAAWRVPEIQQRSPCGVAATWIGARGEGQSFIQVGTNEECVRPWEGALPANDGYDAFWSDTSKSYHPHYLFQTRAGDRIEATLAFTSRRWRITIVDGNTGEKASFTTTDETERRPYSASWTQEDVAVGNSYSPYPHLTEATLSDLLVNGSQPNAEQLTSDTMSVHGELLEPTGLRDDSFQVPPTNG